MTRLPLRRLGLACLAGVFSIQACGGDSGAEPHSSTVVTALAGTNAQTALVGTVLNTPPGVKVTDASGPVANIAVTFAVTGGGGSLTGGATATTDASGIAIAGWKLGTTAGANTMTASVSGAPTVTFTATGTAGSATQLIKSTNVPATAAVGAVITPAPSVTVADTYGNTVSGVTVTFGVTSGGGSISGATATTGVSGIATVGSWTLGQSIGANTLSASAPGLQAVSFAVTSTVGAPAAIVVTPSSPDMLPQQTAQLAVSTTDQFGNAVTSAAVSFTSGAPNIATVSNTGLVTAVAVGQATIAVTAGTFTKNVPINVVAAVSHPAGTLSNRISGISGRPFGIAVSSNGVIATTQQDLNTVTFTDVSGAPKRSVAVGLDPGDVVFNRAGTRAWVSNFNSGTVSVIDVAAGTVVGTISISTNAYRLALSPDESRLFVASTNGVVYVVQLSTSAVSVAANIGGTLRGMAIDASGSFLYVTSATTNVSRISTSTFAVTTSQPLGATPQEVVIAPNGTDVYVANEAGYLNILDASTLVVRAQFPTNMAGYGMAISPDGAQLYLTSPNTSQVAIVDVATRAIIKTLDGVTPRRVAFDRTGRFAVVANEGNFVDVIR